MTTPKPGSPEFILLSILAGCVKGASEYNLVTRHNIAPCTIYRLVATGLVRPTEHRIRSPRNWSITLVHITEAGLAALNRSRDS